MYTFFTLLNFYLINICNLFLLIILKIMRNINFMDFEHNIINHIKIYFFLIFAIKLFFFNFMEFITMNLSYIIFPDYQKLLN